MSDEGDAGPTQGGRADSPLIAHRFALFGALAVAFALTSWFGFFFFRDNFSTHFPAKVISAQAWRAGSIPWWNDADAGGQPLAGNPNTLTFYPDNFLYLLLPPHVAFNLHFLLHLAIGWLVMRALTRGPFGAWLWVLSGAAMSTLGFYNLVVAFAMIPLAFLAIERRSTAMLALSFGLMMLAGEPVVIAATALGCAILAAGRMPIIRILVAAVVAFAIASPQLIAYSEIAAEIERARGFSAQTALNASFDPHRLIEILIGPFARADDSHLFPTLFIGVIVIPALFARSRYVVIAATMFFFALGRFNPVVRAAVEALPSRSARYPEKFALPMCATLVVLAAAFFSRSRQRRLWAVITFLPLIAWAVATVPIDWWAPYALAPQPSQRVYVAPLAGGQDLDRDDFHHRAERREPLFGATAGLRYVLNRSGDGMHSVLSRIAAERWASTRNGNWLRIATAAEMVAVPHAAAAPSVGDAVNLIEAGETHVAPREASSAIAINQTYFRAWVVRNGDRELPTFPIDLDRLGVVAPPDAKLTLTFGRHHTAVVSAWVISSLLIVALLIALRVEKLDRRAGEVKGSGDDDAAVT